MSGTRLRSSKRAIRAGLKGPHYKPTSERTTMRGATQDLCRLQFIQPPKPADDVKNCVKVINYTVNTQEKK